MYIHVHVHLLYLHLAEKYKHTPRAVLHIATVRRFVHWLILSG